MDLGLEGFVVLITGASGGIGRALAEDFAAEGARLVLTGHTRFDELVRHVEARLWKERALCVRADASRPTEIEAAFAAGTARFGRVDVAVANAGAWPRENLLLHRASEERIRGALEANLLSALFTVRAAMASLERTGARADGHGASICFVGSTAGRFGERHHCEYAVAKAGLYGLVRTLKNEIVELDPYARVNMVEPGWTVTHMVRPELAQPGVIARVTRTMPLRQLARAVDIAKAIVLLSSPTASRHTSGQVLTIAGGMEGRALWEASDIDEAAVRARVDHP
ncbi:MAG: SDR family oxidoreductase [Planctomycetes bacterium]|nr:SDR family oxidoreductase [Planctomycetota bacterium]